VPPYFWIFGGAALFSIEAERLKLLAPFSRRIAEALDADASGQATSHCCFDKIGREEGQRDRDRGPALQLFRIESERLKLPAPFSRRIAEPLDADAAGQATFYGCFDEIGCEEGERDGQIDLPNAALLAGAKLSDRGHST
jgi:hypothetical protein